MDMTEQELMEMALAGIRASIDRLKEKERILEADLRRKYWGKKNKPRLGKHDDPGLLDDTRWAVALAHDKQGSVLLEKKEQKKRKRRLSAAGRKAISDAAKARWARRRESQGQTSAAPKQARKKR